MTSQAQPCCRAAVGPRDQPARYQSHGQEQNQRKEPRWTMTHWVCWYPTLQAWSWAGTAPTSHLCGSARGSCESRADEELIPFLSPEAEPLLSCLQPTDVFVPSFGRARLREEQGSEPAAPFSKPQPRCVLTRRTVDPGMNHLQLVARGFAFTWGFEDPAEAARDPPDAQTQTECL